MKGQAPCYEEHLNATPLHFVAEECFRRYERRRIMRKKTAILSSGVIILAMLFSAVFLTLPAEVKAKVVAVEGVSYNVNSSLVDNLRSLVGRKIYVTLDSGKTVAGFLKEVGDHLIHLEKLDGREFFDALIRIEDINAIETRFRNLQR